MYERHTKLCLPFPPAKTRNSTKLTKQPIVCSQLHAAVDVIIANLRDAVEAEQNQSFSLSAAQTVLVFVRQTVILSADNFWLLDLSKY